VVDVAVTKISDAKRIFYEFKSVIKTPPDRFAIQFIKDLSIADDLDQIKWIFDGNKVTTLDKAKFLDELRKVDIAENTINKWVKGFNNPTKSNLIDFLDDNFDKIFL
jgi:hypothetical protein